MVTNFTGLPLEFLLENDPQPSLKVILEFADDPTVDDVSVVSTLHDGGELHLRLVNFDTAEGRGSSRPVLLGGHGEDLYFMHFRVFLFGRTTDRTVHYTLYKVAKADVGWSEASR